MSAASAVRVYYNMLCCRLPLAGRGQIAIAIGPGWKSSDKVAAGLNFGLNSELIVFIIMKTVCVGLIFFCGTRKPPLPAVVVCDMEHLCVLLCGVVYNTWEYRYVFFICIHQGCASISIIYYTDYIHVYVHTQPFIVCCSAASQNMFCASFVVCLLRKTFYLQKYTQFSLLSVLGADSFVGVLSICVCVVSFDPYVRDTI